MENKLIEIRNSYYATTEQKIQESLAAGYWIKRESGKHKMDLFDQPYAEVFLDWPTDPNNPPINGAEHK